MLRRLTSLLPLLAFALAVLLLDARSLWGDEAFSVWASKQPVLALALGLDAQPPLYHLLLKGARALWGESVFALRYLSLCCGVLLVAVGARAGRELGGARHAALTGAVLALSPMLAYYDQEARMYTPAALFAGACALMTISALRRPLRARDWLAYVALAVAALYAHFYTVTILAVNALALLWAALRGPARFPVQRATRAPLGMPRHGGVGACIAPTLWARGAILWAHGAIAIGFGLWFFGLQWAVLTAPGAGRKAALPLASEIVANIQRGAAGLIFGMRAGAELAPLAFGLIALAALGAVGLWRRGPEPGRRALVLTVLGWLGLSWLFIFATAAKSGIVPDFSPRYLLFTLMPLALLAGAWARAGRVRALLAALLALVSLGYGQYALFDRGWAKSRYAALVDTLRERARPGDAAALLNSDQFPLLDYYGPVAPPVWIMNNSAWGAEKQPEAAAQFARHTAGHARVWVLKYGWAATPGLANPVESLLQKDSVRLYQGEFEDATLTLYERLDAAHAQPVRALDIDFGGQIALVGVRPRGGLYRPGDALSLDLIWRAARAPAADYTVFMHLRRADDGAQIAAFDGAPAAGAAPTSGWRIGQVVTDTRGLSIPADAPPGVYRVIVGLYSYPSFDRLRIGASQETEVVAQEVTVAP